MKRILFTLLTVCLVWACYDDKSLLPTVEYPTIYANKNGESQYLTASYGSEFVYEPRLYWLDNKDTVYLSGDEDYDYQWDMSAFPSATDTSKIVISHDRILKMAVDMMPTTSGYSYYTLTLHVTHRPSGVVKNLVWEMKVLSTYGGGLLVAETLDEANSDISLIMSRTFNTNLEDYEADTVHYLIYSKHNGVPVDGLINSFTYVNGNAFSGITALVPGEHVLRIDRVTMEEQDRDMDLFFYEPEVYNPQAIFAAYSTNVLINNGKVQTYAAATANKYSMDIDTPYELSAIYAGDKMDWVSALFFDKNAEKFVYIPTSGTVVATDISTVLSGVFDPRNMQGCEPIYAEAVNSTLTKWLMAKDGKYYVYEVDCNVDYDDDDWPTVFQGKNIYDLENCLNLGQATAFAFSANDEFFYAVGNTLYVATLAGEKPVAQPTYSLPAGEEITHLKIYRGSGYTAWSEDINEDTGEMEPYWRNSKNNVICVATYDGAEGRVYTLPIQYAGSGGIATEEWIRCYEGFGRITGIGTRE